MQRFLRHGRHHLLEVKHLSNPLSRKGHVVEKPKDEIVFQCKPALATHTGNNNSTSKLKKKTIFFIRHGQSESNVAREAKDPHVNTHPRFTDAKLTPLGIKQASALQGLVDKWNVDLVITSPLTRAMQTALHAFHNVNVPMHADPMVTEYYSNLIECKGREKELILQEEHLTSLPRFSNVCLKRVSREWWANCDDLTRPARFLDSTIQLPDRLCVVSHFGTINMFALHEPSVEDLQGFLFPFPFLQNCDAVETTWLLEEP